MIEQKILKDMSLNMMKYLMMYIEYNSAGNSSSLKYFGIKNNLLDIACKH